MKKKAKDHVLFSEQIRHVEYKIYPHTMQYRLVRRTVQEQDEQRQHTVAKLIEMFESHQHREQFLKDMSQTQKIKRFSEASQKLLQDMDQQRSSNSVRTL